MSTLFKAIVAFCVGAGLLHLGQRLLASSITAQIAEQPQTTWIIPHTQVVPTMSFTPEQLRAAITPNLGSIDTTTGQRAAVEGAARQVDLIRRRAQSAVPIPPRSFGATPASR